MSIIVAEALTKRYGSRVGIRDLSLQVSSGEIFGFLGPNGSGKTTTIRVLIGLLRASSGQARIFGLDSWSASARIKAEVGYVPGDLRLYPWLTGEQALHIFGAVRGRDLISSGAALAEQLALDMKVRVRRMSKGMRQKLGLILALAPKPRLLVLDEPTSALDPIVQDVLYQQLHDLAQQGHTIFFSSHTLSEVQQLCDRVAILRDGRLVADETLADLRQRARRVVTIRWPDGVNAAELQPPQFLHIERRDAQSWECSLTGPAPELIRWLARQPVEDFTVGDPDLESLFRRYYAQGASAC